MDSGAGLQTGAENTLGTWLRHMPFVFTLVVICVFLGMAKPFHSDKPNEWDDVYLHSARQLAQGNDLYKDVPLYTYPPFMAWLFIPLSILPTPVARTAWFLICVSSILVMVNVAWKLANARGERLFPGQTTAPSLSIWLIFLVGLAFGARPAFTALLHHQTDLLMDALIFLGMLALARKRPGWGAVCFGFAGAMKCTPLLWCAYYLVAGPRRWMLVPALVAIVANLLPNLTHMPHTGNLWLTDWVQAKVLCLMGTYPGHWNTDVMCNQSLSGSFYAWCVTSWSWGETGFQILSREPLCSPTALKAIVYGIGLTLLTASLALIWWETRQHTTQDRNTIQGLRRWLLREVIPVYPTQALHFSLILLLMLLLSPMSHKTHFGLLLLPGFVLARVAWERRNPVLIGLLGLLITGQIATMHFWSVKLSHFAYWHGIQMFTTLGLWTGCLYSAWRWGRAQALQPVPSIADFRQAA